MKFLLRKKLILSAVISISFICIIFLFRFQILYQVGQFLIAEDVLEPVEYMFVLSGGASDRGIKAADLFKKGFSQKIVCSGETIPSDLKIVGLKHTESEVTKMCILQNDVPEASIIQIHSGTSTWEEADFILHFCQENKVYKCIILSSKFHTRRVKYVFQNYFKKKGIEVLITGSDAQMYHEDSWWESEDGMLMVNNEFAKLTYYFLKYSR